MNLPVCNKTDLRTLLLYFSSCLFKAGFIKDWRWTCCRCSFVYALERLCFLVLTFTSKPLYVLLHLWPHIVRNGRTFLTWKAHATADCFGKTPLGFMSKIMLYNRKERYLVSSSQHPPQQVAGLPLTAAPFLFRRSFSKGEKTSVGTEDRNERHQDTMEIYLVTDWKNLLRQLTTGTTAEDEFNLRTSVCNLRKF